MQFGALFCLFVSYMHIKISKKINTHSCYVTRSILDGSKQAKYDYNNMYKICEDGCPLITKEVKYLPLEHRNLRLKSKSISRLEQTRKHMRVFPLPIPKTIAQS